MNKTLRVLNIEDSELDALLITRHLTVAGYNLIAERVDTSEAMRSALETKEWDVILCDNSMPRFNALKALALFKEMKFDIPFIIISGTIGEETAVEAMRAGADDYLMKDKLARLAPTIKRVLEEAKNQHARRKAEADLRESEAGYRRLIDTAYEGVWVTDADLRTTYVNARLTEMLGVSAEQMIGKDASSFIGEDSRSDLRQRWQRRAQGLKEQYDLHLTRKDGTDLWVIVSATPIHDEQGKFIGALYMLTDITERKKAVEGLRESEERYRLLFERNPQPMWVFDLETLAFLEVNDAAIHHYGYSREEFLALTIKDIRLPEDIPNLLANLSDVSSMHQEAGIWRHRKKDGSIIDVEITAHELIFYGRQSQIVLAYDVTERRMLEEQLRQSQKMEAVGQLAGGIAHDFNNLLTVVNGYSELAMDRLEYDDPLRRNIEEIKKAGDRAAALTRQLLAFSRKQVLQPKVLNINYVVSNLEKLLHRLIGENIELKTIIASDLGSIKANPGQIEQVLMNLAINARDAMPHGGKLIIEAENVYLDDGYTRQHMAVVSGPHVMLAVSDTGTGMDDKTRERIFEPFFTTKGPDKGTGLGLSTVFGIVKQSDGNIWVYSEPGHGTTFKIYLPRVDKGEHEYRAKTQVERIFNGTETILLTEDEEMVRNLARALLQARGYKVLEAADGAAALLLCERYKEKIHLLLTDLVMPEMSGRELADRLALLRPETKVIFMSGYTDNTIVHHEVIDAAANFIQKPFSSAALAEKVRTVLDGNK